MTFQLPSDDINKPQRSQRCTQCPLWLFFTLPPFCKGDNSRKFIDFVEEAAEKRTLAVFMFHGIGGANLITSREAHKELLEYLTKHQDRFWVTTFGEMVRYVKANR